MCEVCEQAPASVTCKADAATLCSACDVDVHSANPLAHHNLSSPPHHHHRDLTNLLINLSSKFSVEQCQLPPQIFSIFANSSIPRISRKMSRKRNQSDDEEDDTFFYRYSSAAACCAPSAPPPTGVACVTACCAPSAAPPTERRTNQEQNLEGSGEISCGIVIDIKEKGRRGDELQFHHSSSNSQRLQLRR